ncbi:MAG: hypothetical protein GXC72_05455 [Chitinophagaceae bacterium]|jgi:hypothetical protein|nr:hypothetical protein [Chitinophagaceae bacterium]
MKRFFATLIAATIISGVFAQENLPQGTLHTTTGEKIEGRIKDQLKTKGTILFYTADGSKKVVFPADVLGFTLGGVNYISYASDFYKEIVSGKKSGLFQRATDNSGKLLYNGAEAVTVTTAEGKSGDFYLRVSSRSTLDLVTKKNFSEVLGNVYKDCSALAAEVKAGQSGYEQLAKLVEKYNNCQ